MAKQYLLESVERVMRVLDCFTLETPELRLTDLSERLGMHKTQVLRIVSTLEAGGYLARDPDTKRYRLGLRVLQLGMVVRHHLDIRRIAHPYLHRLVEATRETARLVVSGAQGPVCIDLVESPQSIRVYAQLGVRMPWHAGTSGKVIFAYLPEERREAILAAGGFRRFTDRTVVDPDALREAVCAIREQGICLSMGDLTPGAQGVAAPIFDEHGAIAGAISLAAPASRLLPADLTRYAELVAETARGISAELGYHEDQSVAGAPAAAAR